MVGAINIPRWIVVAPILFAARSSGCDDTYYDTVDLSLTGAALRAALRARIASPHEVIPYTSTATDVWDALKVLDADPANAESIIEIYSQRSVAASLSGETDGWNREHLWPKSYGVGYEGPDFSDLHHLVPADWGVNAARGNKLFGDCVSDATESCDAPAHAEAAADTAADAETWLPPAAVRGDIARALFYMVVRYDGSEADTEDLRLGGSCGACSHAGVLGDYEWLRRWHDDDPVSDAERARNGRICDDYQGNRNPFVDAPELVARLFDAADVAADRVALCGAPCVDPGDDDGAASTDAAPLAPGAALVVGADAAADAFAIVLLVDVDAVALRVTDSGWSAATGALRDTEGTLVLARSGAAAAGTVLTEADAASTSGSLNLALGGDQLLAYNANGAFVCAFATTGEWSDATSSSTSALPPGLEDGVDALALPAETVWNYAGARSGTAAELRLWIADASNWDSAADAVDATPFDVLAEADAAAGARGTGVAAAAGVLGLVAALA